METLAVLVLPVLAAILLVGARYLVSYLAKKFSISIDTQIRALEFAKVAIMRVEEIAASSASKIPAPEKLKTALTLLDKLASDHPDVLKYIKGKQTDIIENLLKSPLTPDTVTPKAVIDEKLAEGQKVEV